MIEKRKIELVRAYQRHRVSTDFGDEKSLTKQSAKDECDINLIVRRYDNTGVITHVSNVQAQFGESPMTDLQTALNQVIAAEEAFAQLPAAVRKKFDNNAVAFVDFVDNPDNADKLIEMGLAPKPEAPPAPVRVEVVPPPLHPL